MNAIDAFLQSIPPGGVYAIVALVVGLESLGIPLPGEITLVTAAILSSRHELNVSPLWVGLAGAAGAVIGDSIGYEVGKIYGYRLLGWMRKRFPKHVSPEGLAYAQHLFHRFGPVAVFFGRFVALLRIFAGPLSGALRLPYHVFLPANAAGGAAWALGTTYGVYYLGQVAETWLKGFSWVGLVVAVLFGVIMSTVLHRRVNERAHGYAQAHPDEVRDLDEKTAITPQDSRPSGSKLH